MRNFIRWLLRISLVLAVVISGAALWKRDDLIRLYNVNTLFDEGRIVSNFSSMKELFFNVAVKRSGAVAPLAESKRELAKTYQFAGKTKSVQDWLDATKTTSLVVLHNGAIVHESYELGTKPDDQRISWSMAKSFLSAIFGTAVADGSIKSLDDPVDAYVPRLKGTVYEGVTIRNVLRMSSGVKFDEDYEAFGSDINRMGRVLAMGGSMDEFAAGLAAREREQGTARQYTSIDTHILGMVLRAVTGKDLPALMEERLWSKLGVEDDAIFLTDGYGVAFALGGLNMRTRDYARFGQMVLDGGMANGQQIVPADWIMEATAASAPPAAKTTDKMGYGYQWWIPVNSNGEFFAIGI
jgi:hypothetical protein